MVYIITVRSSMVPMQLLSIAYIIYQRVIDRKDEPKIFPFLICRIVLPWRLGTRNSRRNYIVYLLKTLVYRHEFEFQKLLPSIKHIYFSLKTHYSHPVNNVIYFLNF